MDGPGVALQGLNRRQRFYEKMTGKMKTSDTGSSKKYHSLFFFTLLQPPSGPVSKTGLRGIFEMMKELLNRIPPPMEESGAQSLKFKLSFGDYRLITD